MGAGMALGGISQAITPSPVINAGAKGKAPIVQGDTTTPIKRFVYGETMVAGDELWRGNHSERVSQDHDREYFHRVFSFTQGFPCNAIIGVRLDGVEFDLEPNAGAVDHVPATALIPASGKYRDVFFCFFASGDNTESPSPYQYLYDNDKFFEGTETFTDITAVVAIYKYDFDIWPGGPATTDFRLQGAKGVLDVRTGVAGYVTNPALCLRHAYTGPLGPRKGLPAFLISDVTVAAAANKCDEQLTKEDGDVVDRYTVNGWWPATDPFRKTEADLLACMGGTRTKTNAGSTIEVYAAGPRAVAMDLAADDLAGDGIQALQFQRPRAELYNSIHALFRSDATSQTDDQTPEWPVPAGNVFQIADQGQELLKELSLPGVIYSEQAQRLAKIDLLRNREEVSFTATFKSKALLLKAAEVVTYSDARYGWDHQKFQIDRFKLNKDWTVTLDVRGYSDDDYAWLASEERVIDGGDSGVLVLLDDFYDTSQGVAVDTAPIQNDFSATPVTMVSFTQPAHGTAVQDEARPVVVYTPDPAFTGDDSYDYTAHDEDGAQATATVHIHVVSGAGLTALDDRYDISDDAVHTLDVLQNDLPAATPKTVTAVTAPARGTAAIIDAGAHVSYQRNAGANSGTDTFDYTIDDGAGDTDVGTVVISLDNGGGGGGAWGGWAKRGQNSGLRWQAGAGDSAPTGGTDYSGAVSWAERLRVHFPAQTRIDVWSSFMIWNYNNDHSYVTPAQVRARCDAKKPHWQDLADDDVRICQQATLLTQMDVGNIGDILARRGSRWTENQLMWRHMAQVFKDIGAKSPVMRMGHEMNGGSYAWAQITPAQYIALYRLARDEMMAVNDDITYCWNPLRGQQKTIWWPGDNVVDVVGTDWYNNGGVQGTSNGYVNTQADWDGMMRRGTATEPHGHQSWLDFCDNHGKLLCYPEWGEAYGTGQRPGPEQDCPGYVDLFMEFLANNSPNKIMFETYFNNGQHAIDPHPSRFVPNFEIRYFNSWSGR